MHACRDFIVTLAKKQVKSLTIQNPSQYSMLEW